MSIQQGPEPLAESLRVIENPWPHFREAKDAAMRILHLEAEIAQLEARLAARRQARKAAWLGVSTVLLYVALSLAAFWAFMGLHESFHLPSWAVLLAALVSLPASTAGLAWKALHPSAAQKTGKLGDLEENSEPGAPRLKRA